MNLQMVRESVTLRTVFDVRVVLSITPFNTPFSPLLFINDRILSPSPPRKLQPWISIVVPTGPDEGFIEVMTGGLSFTEKLLIGHCAMSLLVLFVKGVGDTGVVGCVICVVWFPIIGSLLCFCCVYTYVPPPANRSAIITRSNGTIKPFCKFFIYKIISPQL